MNERKLHVGKNRQEHLAYEGFLKQDTAIDKTVKEKNPFDTTSDSTFKDEHDTTPKKSNKKSLGLVVSDWVKNNLVNAIVIAVVGAITVGYISIASDQKANSVELANIKTKVDQIETENKETNKNLTELDKTVSNIKIQFEKDIEYIKELFNINN